MIPAGHCEQGKVSDTCAQYKSDYRWVAERQLYLRNSVYAHIQCCLAPKMQDNLIATDDVVLGSTLVALLNSAAQPAVWLGTPREVVAAIRSGPTRGVVLDFQMKPGGSALAILLALNKLCERRPTIVLLIPEVRVPFQLWQSLGIIDSYVIKSAAPAAVLEALARTHRSPTNSSLLPSLRDAISKCISEIE